MLGICIECEIDDGGIGYIYHPEYCDMFVMCIPTIDDVCYKKKFEMQGRTYAHRTNCRSYWECSNGHSLEKCCPKGQAYSSLGRCVPDDTCETLCGQEIEKPIESVERCTRRAVKENPRKYEWDTFNGWIQMNCPPGTIFKEELCECIYFGNPVPGTLDPAYYHQEQEVCTPDVHLTFDDFMDHSGKNSYVYSSNVTLDGYGAGCFDGHSAISLPMFTNMHLGEKLYAKITYKQQYTRQNQALLYNGDCVKSPSLVVTSSTSSNII
ncbi:hypothetical protein KUTeg_023092 [Tegillarca granosa]|uniref:Chitin-binding type-2 domain-containing protein n=1 Tax=Tegillarca granosa TaxID=220873 RepID=A0ABQ9E189_TEGGR|nr:hypothetical protein KUTeg_023092 [Tegillarca granosa]